jgi:chromosome partitioning protein
MISVAFFNNKGGVGKTTLVYHVATMLSRLRLRVLCADLDPQANLTAMFLPAERLEEVLESDSPRQTIFGCVWPIVQGEGDIAPAHIEEVDRQGDLGLILGDLELSRFEDRLALAWKGAADADPSDIKATTSLYRIVARAARSFEADITLIDVGPNLGAINRAALIGSDFVVVPLAADLYSLQGLKNLGPTLTRWRDEWRRRASEAKERGMPELPEGKMATAGYVVLQHAVRLDRPVEAYARWMRRIPDTYARYVEKSDGNTTTDVAKDPDCLASLKNYRSLMPLAQEARKPMFALRVADGAIGAQQTAVRQCYEDFKALTERIADRVGLHALASP